MSKTLIETTEVYRCDNMQEAEDLIAEAKSNPNALVKKSTSEYKEIKVKGEVESTFYKVTLVKCFDDIKNPVWNTKVQYSISGFPDEV